jgi:hypothetical protein
MTSEGGASPSDTATLWFFARGFAVINRNEQTLQSNSFRNEFDWANWELGFPVPEAWP